MEQGPSPEEVAAMEAPETFETLDVGRTARNHQIHAASMSNVINTAQKSRIKHYNEFETNFWQKPCRTRIQRIDHRFKIKTTPNP